MADLAPTDHGRALARAFLAVFLRRDVLDRAVRELDDAIRAEGADGVVAVLRAARSRLHDHAKVTLEAELSVLLLDLALATETVADVLDSDSETVRRIAHREGLDPATVDPAEITHIPIAAPSDAPVVARPAWRRWIVPVALAAVALGLIVVLGGGTGSVRVEDARMTETVDRTGTPGEARTRFVAGEDVLLWFTYDARSDTQTVSVTWWREQGDTERTLYTNPKVALEVGEDRAINVALSSLYSTDPGSYRVEVSRGDDVLVERTFVIEAT